MNKFKIYILKFFYNKYILLTKSHIFLNLFFQYIYQNIIKYLIHINISNLCELSIIIRLIQDIFRSLTYIKDKLKYASERIYELAAIEETFDSFGEIKYTSKNNDKLVFKFVAAQGGYFSNKKIKVYFFKVKSAITNEITLYIHQMIKIIYMEMNHILEHI